MTSSIDNIRGIADVTTKRDRFTGRTVINGVLKLVSDLAICDGGVDDRSKAGGEVATIARDANDQPIIPGSTLKGVLRNYLEEFSADRSSVDSLFGKSSQAKSLSIGTLVESELGMGGKVDFLDSSSMGSPSVIPIPHVGIDRRTGVAADRILYFTHAVERGNRFAIKVVGHNLSEEELDTLLTAFEGFNDDVFPIRLGSGRADHWGRAEWTLGEIHRIDQASLKQWWNSKTPKHWKKAFTQDDRPKSIGKSKATGTRDSLSPPESLSLRVILQFRGPFLVNDAGSDSPVESDYHPRKTPDGKLLLPASSVRGVLRSQAERICRTLRIPCNDPHAKMEDRSEPTFFDELFGVSGRRSALEIEDFIQLAQPRYDTRTFVAIDRFTGGAAHGHEDSENARRAGKLYTVNYAVAPCLQGRLTFNLRHLSPESNGLTSLESIGLIALVLRDLKQGELTFGFGASKGFGKVESAQFQPLHVQLTEQLIEELNTRNTQSKHERTSVENNDCQSQIAYAVNRFRALSPLNSLAEA